MNDLLRSYKMILKRRPSVDSDESQPLVSSGSSTTTTFGAFQDQCMFHDSDSTECEIDKSTKPVKQIQTTRNSYLRSFSYPGHRDDSLSLDIFTAREDVYDRCEYFAKVSGILSDNHFITSQFLSFKYEKLEAITTQSSLVTIFAIWNTIMGTSLLAMTWGFERSGLIPGIFLHLLIAGICVYTAQLILSISKNHALSQGGRITEVPELCRDLLGPWAEILARIFSLIVLIGANIVYWILMSNFLYNFVDFIYDYVSYPDIPDNRTVICPKLDNALPIFNSTVDSMTKSSMFHEIWHLNNTVPIFLAILLFPLLNFKSPTFFTKFNSLGTLSALYMVIFVCVKSYVWGISNIDWVQELNFKSSFSALSGMLALSYFIHNIVISVMRSNRNQEHNVRDLSIAYSLVLFTYLFVGVLMYISFPLAKSCIEDNILNNFPKSDPMTIGARVLLLFQLFTVFPLMSFMLRMDIFNNFKAILKKNKTPEFSYFKVIALNLILIVVCILFACFLPKIGTLIRYTGAMSGMVYVFTIPCLLKMSSLRNEKLLTPVKCILYISIIAIGVLNFCSQFFVADG